MGIKDGELGASHPPFCHIQPRQQQWEDVEAALSIGLLGNTGSLQQQGLGTEKGTGTWGDAPGAAKEGLDFSLQDLGAAPPAQGCASKS